MKFNSFLKFFSFRLRVEPSASMLRPLKVTLKQLTYTCTSTVKLIEGQAQGNPVLHGTITWKAQAPFRYPSRLFPALENFWGDGILVMGNW